MHVLLAALTVLFVGDSLTQYPTGFAQGGERAVTYYLADSILFLEEAGYYDRIVIELGVHAVRGADRLYDDNLALFERRYERLLDTALAHADEVVVINIPWLDWGPENHGQAKLFNFVIEGLASERGVRVIDAWTLMETCGLACIGPDGFHPNQKGHNLIRARLVKYYIPLVTKEAK